LSLTFSDFNEIEDALEWNFALVMIAQFLVSAHLWHQSGFRLQWPRDPT
jgi:hypothetical protein